MKSIKESIIGRKNISKKLMSFDDLRYGDFVTIEIPTNRYIRVFLYVPDNIAKLVCDIDGRGPNGFGRFISAKKYSNKYIVPEIDAAIFKDNFPEYSGDKNHFYSKITNYNGHTEEYKSIKKEKDIVDIFRKYRFL